MFNNNVYNWNERKVGINMFAKNIKNSTGSPLTMYGIIFEDTEWGYLCQNL